MGWKATACGSHTGSSGARIGKGDRTSVAVMKGKLANVIARTVGRLE